MLCLINEECHLCLVTLQIFIVIYQYCNNSIVIRVNKISWFRKPNTQQRLKIKSIILLKNGIKSNLQCEFVLFRILDHWRNNDLNRSQKGTSVILTLVYSRGSTIWKWFYTITSVFAECPQGRIVACETECCSVYTSKTADLARKTNRSTEIEPILTNTDRALESEMSCWVADCACCIAWTIYAAENKIWTKHTSRLPRMVLWDRITITSKITGSHCVVG